MKKSKIHKNEFDGNIVFGNKAFHEGTNRDQVIENVVVESRWGQKFFQKKNGGLEPIEKYFDVLENCPCCNSKKIFKKIVTRGISIYECSDCLFGFQNPMIKPQFVAEIYEELYVMDVVYSSDMANELDRIKFLYGIQIARSVNPNITSVLDVGCGAGHSLDVYESAGITKVLGIDPGEYTKNGLPDTRIQTSFMEVVPDNFTNISLVTMWDTLEHIHDFQRMLNSIYDALEVGGVVLIMVPNFRSLATRLIKEKSPVFQIDHISYFSKDALTFAMESAKFNVRHFETVISEIDNCRNYLEFNEPYFSTPKCESAFEWLTPDYIHQNMLGSRLLVIGQK